MVCPNCYSSNFRLSRFRSHDLPRLFFLQYPVRCQGCKERLPGNLFFALNLLRKRHHDSSHHPPGPQK